MDVIDLYDYFTGYHHHHYGAPKPKPVLPSAPQTTNLAGLKICACIFLILRSFHNTFSTIHFHHPTINVTSSIKH